LPRIQLKLMAALAVLVAVTVLASGYVAERGLRERELARIERSLQERSELVRELVAGIPFEPAATAQLDERVRRAAAASGARVTFIASEGTVVADSDVAPVDLVRVENHGEREEVRAALEGRVGRSARPSETVGRRLLYLAVPLAPGPDAGVVRLAVNLEEIEADVADLRRELMLASLIGFAAALALSFLLSWITVRPLSEMREALGAIARGDLGQRLRPRSDDELGEMAGAINDMAEELGLRLEEVTAEKEQLHAVLEGMVEGVLVLDPDACVTLANPRLRELLSLWGPVEGRKLLEVVRHPGIDDALRAAAGSTAPVVSEVEIGERTPRTLLIHAAAFPQEGPYMGTVAVFHDVTELRHLEMVRRDFVANASHELQTPLTAIRGFAETLIGNDLSWEEVRAQLDVILRNAERLENLIRDMRELSRVESRRVPLQPAEVDVSKLTSALLSDMEPRLKECSLEVSVADRGAVLAWADRRAVDQVLTNLLDNALKYTDPGGRITVEIEGESEVVRVSVSDTGIGIPSEHQDRIFERFYRVDKARSRSLGGTGLGLAIVKHLVQAMGGEVYVESEPGRGSTFRLTLPRADRRPA
jgi:two-component system phosphate regulon sensor histidine kinase PhoR